MTNLIERAAISLALCTVCACNHAPEPPSDQAIIEAAQNHIKSTLKDPESARFEILFSDAGRRVVCGSVNAKNSFGGYVGAQDFIYRAGTVYSAKADFDAYSKQAFWCRLKEWDLFEETEKKAKQAGIPFKPMREVTRKVMEADRAAEAAALAGR